MKVVLIVLGLAILAIILVSRSLFVVDETEQVLVTRFGEVKSVKAEPGLYFKAPWDTATPYERRVLLVDAPVERMLDEDINILEIDVYARYRIVDPEQFRRTLGTEATARSVLGARINAALRAEVATRNREEIIGGRPERDELGNIIFDEEGNSRVIPTETRTEILNEVLAAVKRELPPLPEGRTSQADNAFGVEMIDVRIKRADFPGEVADRIFARMRSERERISSRLRAEGAEEGQRIRAQADRQRELILAEADRDGAILRGEGEAEAIRILAAALERDPEFFAFRRTLESYRRILNDGTTAVLSSDADLLKLLQSPAGVDIGDGRVSGQQAAAPPASGQEGGGSPPAAPQEGGSPPPGEEQPAPSPTPTGEATPSPAPTD